MRFGAKYKQVVLFVVALAIMPLLFGNAVHQLIPHSCPARCHSDLLSGEDSYCCTFGQDRDREQEQEPDRGKSPTPYERDMPPVENPCPVCEFLSMAFDVASDAVPLSILHHVEQHESKPVRLCVVLYRPFEPARAPPTPV